ncbi:LANO_0A06414g1_1 [Lachancea nothofagi CBS 11611]|uniref:LANO_0A06414g1_1 n=1 Tax=Lachancea nothofagi CBS 11611 TaxID=1266666 RepID=A0A1G4IS32_9SACH|nr:LANO_0A06414g1_1 [Lachancea nothofagi CBS 11611]
MKAYILCCALFTLICTSSATLEFDRTFQSLRERAMPTLTASSTSASPSAGSNSTITSSYRATFTPLVPGTVGNSNIQRTVYPSGTVFVIVGSIMGFVGVVILVTWISLAVKAWCSARREYKSQAAQTMYQADPFMFHSNDSDTEYSDGSDHSDVSEKVLKTRGSTRPSIYSLGSQSTLNLLQRGTQTGAVASSAHRNSMFISPTEIMKNTTNGKSILSLGTPTSEQSNFSSPVQNTEILGKADPLYQLVYGEQRSYRPPSVHLEKMFDDDL